jgi:hypothetical protein
MAKAGTHEPEASDPSYHPDGPEHDGWPHADASENDERLAGRSFRVVEHDDEQNQSTEDAPNEPPALSSIDRGDGLELESRQIFVSHRLSEGCRGCEWRFPRITT